MDLIFYLAKDGNAFPSPANSGVSPSITQGSNTTTVAQAQQSFSTTRNAYDTYHTYDKASKAQLLASVNHLYIANLHNDGIGVLSVKTLTILTHLCPRYGIIDDNQLGDLFQPC